MPVAASAERLLLQKQRELASYRSRLISTICHELKNPLASMLAHLELVELEPDVTGSVTKSTPDRAVIYVRRSGPADG